MGDNGLRATEGSDNAVDSRTLLSTRVNYVVGSGAANLPLHRAATILSRFTLQVLLHLICHMGASPGGFFPILSWQLFRDLLS